MSKKLKEIPKFANEAEKRLGVLKYKFMYATFHSWLDHYA